MFHFKENYKHWQFWLRLTLMIVPIMGELIGYVSELVSSYLDKKLPKVPKDIKERE